MPDRLRDLGDGRLPAQVGGELRDLAVDAQRELLEVARDAHGPGAVAEVALDLAEDRRDRVARERDLAGQVEPVDRLDEAEARDLEEVVEGLLRPLVAAGELARERQEPLDEQLAVDGVAPVEVALEEGAILRGPVAWARRLVAGAASGRTWGDHGPHTRQGRSNGRDRVFRRQLGALASAGERQGPGRAKPAGG